MVVTIDKERRAKGEKLFNEGWRIARTFRVPKQGRHKGWVKLKKHGAGGMLQIPPETAERIKELEEDEGSDS
jgi:hypothetical protein